MDIYVVELNQFYASYFEVAGEWLSTQELEQIERYQHQESRKQALVSFSMRRRVLSGYLNCHPKEIEFVAGSYGKPQLAGIDHLHFNVSHSGEYIVIAVSDNPVGIDLEEHDIAIDALGVGSMLFAEAEMQLLKRCSIEEACVLFYDLWTKKEAFLKATGWGFHFENPSQFDFSSKDCSKIKINGSHYQVSNIPHLPGYSLAICQKEHTKCQIERIVAVI